MQVASPRVTNRNKPTTDISSRKAAIALTEIEVHLDTESSATAQCSHMNQP